ncbi:MAG: MlaA family lipoprotein [Luteimonas sp.]
MTFFRLMFLVAALLAAPGLQAQDAAVVDPNAEMSALVDAAAASPSAVESPTQNASATTQPAYVAPVASDQRSQAEQDYDALYGDPSQPYDPVADPTLPAPVQMPASYDPWEKLNRRTHKFNNAIDRTIALPLARAYVKITPRPVRLGVSNFFDNLGQPVGALNALLQGKPQQAGQSLGRFVVNSTIGLVGIFDPATKFHIPNKSEDLGQTLGVWGWKRSRYLELPLFGPRTVRDVLGLVGDGQLSPIRQIQDDTARVFIQGLQLVDVRTQLMAIDSLREGATDEYALFRDSWLQRRNYQIFGDRQQQSDASLPDYLRDDEDNPTVPADAMPIIPGSSVP